MLKDVGIEVLRSIQTRSKCSMHAGDDSMHTALGPCFYTFWHLNPYILHNILVKMFLHLYSTS